MDPNQPAHDTADPRHRTEEELERLRAEVALRDRQIAALMGSAQAILRHHSFEGAARAIFDYCRELTGATSGYVALLSDDGQENEVLFLESGGLPCAVDPTLPMPIRGLRSRAYAERRAVYDNGFMGGEWARFMPAGHVVLRNVMFAPLVLDDRAVGLIGLANKPGAFGEEDARLAASLGELAAVALQNSRSLDERARAEAERERVIAELREALDRVKRLSGLLPICASCKKIRDDRGYWDEVEVYLHEHADVQFTHGLCPECMAKLYPDYKADE